MIASAYDLTLVSALVVVVLLVIIFKRRKVASQLAPVFALQKSVNELSLEEARQGVERFLSESEDWTTVPATEAVSKYHPTINAFFSTYRAVLRKDETLGVDFALIDRRTFEGYVTIGDVFAADVFTLFDPNTGETVALVEGDRPSEGLRFPSVYHYMLFEIRSFIDD
jgi:hypothetical protein